MAKVGFVFLIVGLILSIVGQINVGITLVLLSLVFYLFHVIVK